MTCSSDCLRSLVLVEISLSRVNALYSSAARFSLLCLNGRRSHSYYRLGTMPVTVTTCVSRRPSRSARIRGVKTLHPTCALIATTTLFWVSACQTEPALVPPDSPAAVAMHVVADHLSIDPANTRVISETPVEFPDSALGCPEPGMSYLQVITPGHRIIVEAFRTRYDVRVANGYGRICLSPTAGGSIGEPRRESIR